MRRDAFHPRAARRRFPYAPLLGTALALYVAGVAGAGPAQASFPGANGSIAVERSPGDSTIDIVPLDGGAPRYIITDGRVPDPANIAWSPDGRKLAFDGPATSLGSGRALYTINADGSGLKQVGRGDRLRFNPAFSPDGKKLAFVQDNGRGGSGDIYTISTSGADLQRLTAGSTWDASPDWSPDGTRIAYVCYSGGRRHACQMTPKGSGKTVTTAKLGLLDVASVSWSPDSRRIAMAATAPGSDRATAYTMTRVGLELRRFPYGPTQRPAWSPDGSAVAFGEYTTGGDMVITIFDPFTGALVGEAFGPDLTFDIDPGGWQPLP
jgi:TolB protein